VEGVAEAIGGLLFLMCFIGSAVIARRMRKPSDRQSERDHTPRTGPPPFEGPQMAGFECAGCGKRIITADEGAPCPDCKKPMHIECLPHRHSDDETPYRG
jgi:hypothetical protein